MEWIILQCSSKHFCMQVAVLCGGKTAPCTASSACLGWPFDGRQLSVWPAEGPRVPRESVKEPFVTFSGPQLHVYPIISPYLLSFIAKVLHHSFYLSLAQHYSISMNMLKFFLIHIYIYAQVKKNKQQLLNVWLFSFNLKSFSPFFLSRRLRVAKPLQFFPFKIVFLLLKK